MSSFSLAGKGLKLDTKEDIQKHIQPLSDNDKITSIDLSGNTLGVGACEALAPVLKSKSTLEFADLHDIFTQRLVDEIPPALDYLLTALLECPNLHTIDLSDNAFGLKTKDPLVDFLSKHTPLRHLILNNNGMGPIAGTSIAEALTQLAKRKEEVRRSGKEVPDLESIVCGRNRLENGSMEAWAQAYSAHNKMKSVKMTQNGIRPEGIVELIKNGLSKCKSLEVFDLQDNTFTFRGATALASAIQKWPQLKELGVGDDLLGGRGSIKVFEVLAKGQNKNVEVLRLDFNDITPAGVASLLTAAQDGLPSLRRVEINGNKFEEDDASIEKLSALLEERKDEKGTDNDPEDHWGIGELDELEGEAEDDEEEDEEDLADEDEEEEEKNAEQVHKRAVGVETLKADEKAENADVGQKKDKDVDDLADLLDKTKV
ncbi:Ran GAP Rna1 [Lithohypha guttulata]|uniref:Ran GAP Rna1 n=1 Tax=Lithohypha guttulata TaxID=1690604 RepID=UPI002DE0DF7F|nr:Ran GAP Rna1 [Lithohypha guttulata]KAK5106168.1 Ran GAP Rna1 [Lithohypha guttulata]